jgi:hypothetical protein
MLLIAILFLLNNQTLFEARFTGPDAEYAQGAIERRELPHFPITKDVWIFAADGDPDTWQTRLNDSLGPHHGSFAVRCATAEEIDAVTSGQIELQR